MSARTVRRKAAAALCVAGILAASACATGPLGDRVVADARPVEARGIGVAAHAEPSSSAVAAPPVVASPVLDAGGLSGEHVLAAPVIDRGGERAVVVGRGDPAPAPPAAPERGVPAVVLPGRTPVPALVYHHVVPDGEIAAHRGNPMVISASALEEQFRWLSEQGFHAVSPDELLRHYEAAAPLPPRPIWITFDDGYESVYSRAFPVLRRYRLRATVFLVTAWVGRPRYLRWDEVTEMARSGLVQIDSHSHDLHRMSDHRPVALGLPQEAILSDLMESRRRIVRHTGREPVAIAYPYGTYSPDILAAARRAGFRLGVRADEQRHPVPGDRLLLLPRYGVFQWKRMPTFRAMLAR